MRPIPSGLASVQRQGSTAVRTLVGVHVAPPAKQGCAAEGLVGSRLVPRPLCPVSYPTFAVPCSGTAVALPDAYVGALEVGPLVTKAKPSYAPPVPPNRRTATSALIGVGRTMATLLVGLMNTASPTHKNGVVGVGAFADA